MAGLNLFTNNAATTLASSILVGATSLTVAAGTGGLFPSLAGSQYFYCTLANTAGTTIEIVKVTARSTDTFTIVRAQDNTSASAFSAGDKVELRLTAIDLQNFPQLDSTNTFATTQTFTTAPVFTDATGTRSAISAAKSGANSDITSITGLTTALSVAQGGTGATTLTANNVLLGNGTSAPSFVAPGASGNVLLSNGSTWTSGSAAAFPAGTRLSFQQTAAPTGWTKDTTAAINDSLLRLVTGSVTPSGGSIAFTTWAAGTTTGATTLSESQIPSHTHSYTAPSGTGTAAVAGKGAGFSVITGTTGATTGGTGGGGSHTHSLSNSIKYYDFIIASKD